MNRVEAMTGLINNRFSKTMINHIPLRGNIRGIPIYIGAEEQQKPIFGGSGSGWGGSWFLANLEDAIQQTRSDIETFRNEIYTTANFPASSTSYNKVAGDYYVNVVVPYLKDWNEFAYKHTHGWSKFLDNFMLGGGVSTWHSLNEYRQRLLDIRNAAEASGFSFMAPRPNGPNLDIIDELTHKMANIGREVWDLGKWILMIGAVAIGIAVIILILGKAPSLGSTGVGSAAKFARVR